MSNIMKHSYECNKSKIPKNTKNYNRSLTPKFVVQHKRRRSNLIVKTILVGRQFRPVLVDLGCGEAFLKQLISCKTIFSDKTDL